MVKYLILVLLLFSGCGAGSATDVSLPPLLQPDPILDACFTKNHLGTGTQVFFLLFYNVGGCQIYADHITAQADAVWSFITSGNKPAMVSAMRAAEARMPHNMSFLSIGVYGKFDPSGSYDLSLEPNRVSMDECTKVVGQNPSCDSVDEGIITLNMSGDFTTSTLSIDDGVVRTISHHPQLEASTASLQMAINIVVYNGLL